MDTHTCTHPKPLPPSSSQAIILHPGAPRVLGLPLLGRRRQRGVQLCTYPHPVLGLSRPFWQVSDGQQKAPSKIYRELMLCREWSLQRLPSGVSAAHQDILSNKPGVGESKRQRSATLSFLLECKQEPADKDNWQKLWQSRPRSLENREHQGKIPGTIFWQPNSRKGIVFATTPKVEFLKNCNTTKWCWFQLPLITCWPRPVHKIFFL